jgi:hypothetical protein
MKKIKLTAIILVAVSMLFPACTNIFDPDDKPKDKDPVTIFAEDFGTTAVQDGTQWPALAAYTGFNKTGLGKDSVSYSSEVGLVTLRTNSPSQGYNGASGSVNAMMASGGATLLVNNIAVCGAKNLVLTFGSNQTDANLKVAYKINGTSQWVELTYSKDTENWGLVDSVKFTLADNAKTIKLRFTAAVTQFGTRVDDIKIITKDATTAPVYEMEGNTTQPTGNDPAPVVALNENFESFTTGTGDAYFSTQTDNKGWFGFKTKGTLEADLRTFNSNKYVQFSAHRTAITTATEQEFWLLSPRLDLSAATSKQLSFSTSAGFFNASTVFEVYIIDGNTPTATKTKLEGWRMPVAADLSGSYTPFIPSGTIDLSAYTGVKRIGFYYKGTSGSGNSTTYQLDNFIFGDIPTLTVTPASLSFAHGGEAKTFTVSGNRTWNAVSSDPTNFAVAVSGTTVTVTAAANTTGSSRTATVTVTATDNSVTQTVSLSQAAQTASGTNIVANGDFSAAWTSGVPTGWTVDLPANITIAQGKDTLVINNPTATTKLFQEIPVEAGASYNLEFTYASTHARFRIWSGFRSASGGSVTFLTSDATTDDLRTKNLYFPVATAPARMNYTFTVPAGQSIFLLEFRYYSQASSTFKLTGVKLVKQ